MKKLEIIKAFESPEAGIMFRKGTVVFSSNSNGIKIIRNYHQDTFETNHPEDGYERKSYQLNND